MSGELDCLDGQLASCDSAADASGVTTAGGRYDCGHEIFEQTDQRLNQTDAAIIAKAKVADAEDYAQSGVEPFREEMVSSSQRKWLPYRDETCEIAPSWVRMGSGRDSVMLFCAAQLTVIQIHVLEESL